MNGRRRPKRESRLSDLQCSRHADSQPAETTQAWPCQDTWCVSMHRRAGGGKREGPGSVRVCGGGGGSCARGSGGDPAPRPEQRLGEARDLDQHRDHPEADRLPAGPGDPGHLQGQQIVHQHVPSATRGRGGGGGGREHQPGSCCRSDARMPRVAHAGAAAAAQSSRPRVLRVRVARLPHPRNCGNQNVCWKNSQLTGSEAGVSASSSGGSAGDGAVSRLASSEARRRRAKAAPLLSSIVSSSERPSEAAPPRDSSCMCTRAGPAAWFSL